MCFSERPLGGICSEVQAPVVIQVLEVHHLLAAIPIDGSLGLLKQVLQVFATEPYHHKLHI